MQRRERIIDFDNPVVTHDKWQVYEMPLTMESTQWLWNEMRKSPTLFSDLTKGDADNFIRVLTKPSSYWLEVRELDKRVGILYASAMGKIIDADVHIAFFDRKLADKTELCRKMLTWFFAQFPGLQRVTATVPSIYHTTIRLAFRLGFQAEGRKRRSMLIGGRLVDEFIFGLTYEDLNGLNHTDG